MSEYNRHRWAMEWMHGGGRDPNGRSLDEEIRIGKEDWLERQRVAQGGRIGLQSGQLVQPGPGRQGYAGKDYRELEPEFVERIREKIKLKPGQKWRFDLHTFGVPKGDPLYNKARYYGDKREKDIIRQAEYREDPEKLKRIKKTQKKRYDIHKEEILEQGKEYRAKKDVAKKRIIQQAEYAASPHGSSVRKAYRSKQMAEVGVFPSGNNYNENVWRDLWRSSQKKGQERFIWVDENGNRLSKKDLPKKDGKVNWTSDYKKIKFYDTKTKQFIKLDDSIKGKGISMEKYLNQKSVGGSGAYEGAVETYKNKDAYKAHKIMYKGKKQNLGTILRDKLFSPMDKKKAQFGKSVFHAAHPDINNQWWKSEVAFVDANLNLEKLDKRLVRDMKLAKDTTAKNKVLANYAKEVEKQPGGITRIIEGKTYGIKPTEKSVITAAGQEANLMKSKNFRKFVKQNPKLATQAAIRLNSGLPIDEIMKMPGMKKALPWIKGEGYFAFADMLNNWSKGQSFFKGLGKGVEMATFNLVDFDTDEKALLMHAVKKGLPDNEIKAMLDYLKYKKEEKKLTGLDTSLAYLDYHEKIGGELTPSHILNPEEGWNYGDREMLNKKIAESKQNLEKLYNTYYEGENRDPTIGLVTLENMMESLTAEEWNKTAGIPGIDRGYREMVGAKADEGMVWGPIFGSSTREFFESIGGEETDSLKAFKPQELMSAHPVYGYKEQIKDMESRGYSPMEDIRGHFDYALPEYAQGGIASLKKK